MEDKVLFMLHSQSRGYWWPGSLRSSAINTTRVISQNPWNIQISPSEGSVERKRFCPFIKAICFIPGSPKQKIIEVNFQNIPNEPIVMGENSLSTCNEIDSGFILEDHSIPLGFRMVQCYSHANLHVTRWLMASLEQRGTGDNIQD